MTNDPKANELDEIREQLAAIEHERWADWQKWCHKILRANIKHDIEPTLARWEKQIATPYDQLSRPEQLSDLEQVDRYWPLILKLIKRKESVARIDELTSVSAIAYANYDQTILGDTPEVDIHDWCINRIKEIKSDESGE